MCVHSSSPLFVFHMTQKAFMLGLIEAELEQDEAMTQTEDDPAEDEEESEEDEDFEEEPDEEESEEQESGMAMGM